MISLLVVSHSAQIAEGVKALAGEMGRGLVQIAAAGGTQDGHIGTSVDLIAQALATLPPDADVLVLVDLGSAVLSAELALEVSGARYRICNAPLVEGAVFAAACAAAGGTLEQTAHEAERSRELVKVTDARTDTHN